MTDIFQWFANPGVSNFATWVVAVFALMISIRAIRTARSGQRRQSELSARMLEIEEGRDAAAQVEGTKARLVLNSVNEGGGKIRLHIVNAGIAEAREVEVTLDGQPFFEHEAVPRGQREIPLIGPGSESSYLLSASSGDGPPWEAEVRWTDDSGEPGSYRTTVTF